MDVVAGAIEVGGKYIKNCGRDCGQEVEVVKVFDDSFVMIRDGKGKESKCAKVHLEPKA